MENPENTTGTSSDSGTGTGGDKRDPVKELQARLEAALDEVRPKLRRALDELDARVEQAVNEVKPRAKSAMEEVKPKMDQLVADVQPRLDSLLERLSRKIDDLRKDLDERATKASAAERVEPVASIPPTTSHVDGPASDGTIP